MKIKNTFLSKKKLFIPFLMAGLPSHQESIAAILALSDAGADLIELGVPFSDPVADGPINQRAAQIALEKGVTLESIFDSVQEIRVRGCQTPLILFSYLNPILSYGIERFAKKAKSVGIDGILIVDLPPEEDPHFYKTIKDANLEIVLLASPTTESQRYDAYRRLDPSFIYYISRLGVTGLQPDLTSFLQEDIKALRKHLPLMKIAIGFGISSTAQATLVAECADGVIIGSLLVKTLEEEGLIALKKIATELSNAIHHIS